MADYILSCESTVDLPYSYVSGRNIPVLFYSYQVDGQVYEDDMMRHEDGLEKFYKNIYAGKIPSTSQLNQAEYEAFFEELLQKADVLHLVFGSGMTSSIRNAIAAAETVRPKFPDRRLIVIDTTCSCCGYGLFVDMAADIRDEGASIDELAAWVNANYLRIHHQFFTTDLQYFRRSGRMSGSAAMLGTILNICPIMRLDRAGRIRAYDKVRGKKNAIRRTLSEMEAHAVDGLNYAGKCFIGHSDCPEDAAEMKKAIEERFLHLAEEVRVYNIGTIIASHCGPNTVSVYFLGDERWDDKE